MQQSAKAAPEGFDPPAHFIDGEASPPTGARAANLVDPATGAVRGRAVFADMGEVERAVEAARRAFEAGWGRSPKSDRLGLLDRLIAAIEARREDFARVISAEIGAPIDFARVQHVDAALGHLRATAAALGPLPEDAPLSTDPEHRARFEPLGVAALITPWNWPLNQTALKVGAALAAGCAMVLKSSELAPESGALFAECVAAAGAPRGVFNHLIGDAETGAALIVHPEIDVVSFTGSTETGRRIAEAAGRHLKKAILELGGKSPNILFADCDPEVAVRQGLAHCFRNAGQSCNAASRMLVERAIYDRVVALAAETARQTEVAPPSRPGAHLGPLVSQAQFDRVQALIGEAIAQGARPVAGGPGRPDGVERGFFVRPTVFADVTPDMAIFRTEAFGPVLTLTPFDTEEDAVRLANETAYGLAAYIQSADEAKVDRVCRRLRVGMIQVNGRSREAGAPFGGVKASGFGRESGAFGIREFQAVKSISGARAVEP